MASRSRNVALSRNGQGEHQGRRGGRKFVTSSSAVNNPNRKASVGEKLSDMQMDVFRTRLVQEEIGKIWQGASATLTRDPINGETGTRVMVAKDLKVMETEIDSLNRTSSMGHVGIERKLHRLEEQTKVHYAQTSSMVDRMYDQMRVAHRLLKSDAVEIHSSTSMESVQALQATRAAITGTLRYPRDRKSLAKALGQFFLDKWQTEAVWLVIVGERGETGWYVFYNEHSHVSMKVGDNVIFIAEVTDDDMLKNGTKNKNSLLENNVKTRIVENCHDIVQFGDQSQAAKQICDMLDERFGESFQCVYGKRDKFYAYFACSPSIKLRMNIRVKVQVGVDKEVEVWRQ